MTMKIPNARSFPPNLPMHPRFPNYYRKYPRPSNISPGHAAQANAMMEKSKDFSLDLYTPRFVKGNGLKKMALCPLCMADGLIVWKALKISAYWYHMNYTHGISAVRKLPYSPPIDFQTVLALEKSSFSSPYQQDIPSSQKRAKTKHYTSSGGKEKEYIAEGLCHECDLWIPLEQQRTTESRTPEMMWWQHASK